MEHHGDEDVVAGSPDLEARAENPRGLRADKRKKARPSSALEHLGVSPTDAYYRAVDFCRERFRAAGSPVFVRPT